MNCRKTASLLLIALALLVLAFTPSANALSPEGTQLAQAYRVAQQHVSDNSWGQLEHWDGGKVRGGLPLYDVDDNLTAWGFNIIKHGEEIGYVIVSTRYEPLQVVEYGDAGGLPFDNLLLGAKSAVVQRHGKVTRHKFLYPMALNYGVQFVAQGKAEPVYWLNRMGIVSKSEFPVVITEANVLRVEDWTIQNIAEEQFLPNVADYSWRRGCSPTASANQLAYLYYQSGHTNLPLGNALIDALANAMLTDANGATARSSIGPGMVSVLSSYGYPGYSSWLEGRGLSHSTFGRFRSEIQALRTVHCVLDSSSDDWYFNTKPGTAQAHSVTGMCYRITLDGSNWIVVHDTWWSTPTRVFLRYGSVEMGTPQWVYLQWDGNHH